MDRLPRVLVVDDEEDLLCMLGQACRLLGYDMQGASSLARGLEHALNEDFTCVLLDNHFPEGHAEQIIPQILSAKPQLPIIMITGNPEDSHVAAAMELGAREILSKPFGLQELSQCLSRYAGAASGQGRCVA